jgi:gamma-glutamylcysteine synthetase
MTPAPGPSLLSTELEAPVVSLRDGQPAPPEVFRRVWERLAEGSWSPLEFGVSRESPGAPESINPSQTIVTDTGPTIELVTSPQGSIVGIQRQLGTLQAEARAALEDLGYGMLGSGVHPGLRAVPADYYRYRTPRPAYDYAIEERSWRHWSIVNIAAVQEVVDVSFDDAPRAVRLLHRLAGLMNFVLRNDPDLFGDYGGRLSVRPQAWWDHVPRSGPFAADAGKVGVPARELHTWRDYLSLLWEESPMFLAGTKDHGAVWVPEHPSFIRFLEDAPADGWPARSLSGEAVRVRPAAEHIAQTDWTYMGFARIRWKWRRDLEEVGSFLEAWRGDDIESFLASHVEKLVVENRCNSTQPPAHPLVSLALVSGLLANLDDALELATREPYAFWVSVLDASTTEPLDTTVEGRSIPAYAREMVDLARQGLRARGEDDPDSALSELDRRIDEKTSPSEELLREYRSGGLPRLLEVARL